MRKRQRHGCLSFFAAALTVAVSHSIIGCSRAAPPEGPTCSVVPADDLDRLWEASLRVLRLHDFQPDRQDRAAGIITTFRTTSMQWHEPWRSDVADGYSLAMSSLHTVQRQVTVRFVRDRERANDWTLDVQVDVYLLNAPDYQVTTASSAIRSFSGDLPSVTGEVGEARGARRWSLVGRDPAMEDRLLERILAYE